MVLMAIEGKTKMARAFLIDFDIIKNVKRQKIKNKFSLRGVNNIDMVFDDIIVEDKYRMNVNGFKDIADMLAHSRLFVCWTAVGVGLGIYDNLIQYISTRK